MYKFRNLLESTQAAIRIPCLQFVRFRDRDVSFLTVIRTCKMLDENPEGRYQGIREGNIKPSLKTKINTIYIQKVGTCFTVTTSPLNLGGNNPSTKIHCPEKCRVSGY